MPKNRTNLFKIPIITFFVVLGMLQTMCGQDFDQESSENQWTASWVTVPDAPARDYGLYYFRKKLTLQEKPSQFVVHVSADNRYKLYVNEQLVSLGQKFGMKAPSRQ